MCKVYVCLIIFLVLTGMSVCHIWTPQNDWTPITKDEVLRRLGTLTLNRRNADSTRVRVIQKGADSSFVTYLRNSIMPNILPEENQDNSFKNSALKIIRPFKTVNMNQQNAFYPVAPDTITFVNDLQSALAENNKQEIRDDVAKSSKHHLNEDVAENATIDNNFRMAKAMMSSSFSNKINDANEQSKQAIDDEKIKKEYDSVFTPKENRKDYQVTEDESDLEDQHSNTEEQAGYFYIPPKVNHIESIENNYTNIFLDILSKHNIQPGDNLPNYSLSRKHKNQNPLNGYMLVPIPLRAFPQFNNLNLDPLAVLLSNYGYYLPGSYGIRGKYRNLYGYLASNNIHNNKPFDSYKIFSDTDSSN